MCRNVCSHYESFLLHSGVEPWVLFWRMFKRLNAKDEGTDKCPSRHNIWDIWRSVTKPIRFRFHLRSDECKHKQIKFVFNLVHEHGKIQLCTVWLCKPVHDILGRQTLRYKGSEQFCTFGRWILFRNILGNHNQMDPNRMHLPSFSFKRSESMYPTYMYLRNNINTNPYIVFIYF